MCTKIQSGPKSGVAPPLLSETLGVSDRNNNRFSSRTSFTPVQTAEKLGNFYPEIDLGETSAESRGVRKPLESNLSSDAMNVFNTVGNNICSEALGYSQLDLEIFGLDQGNTMNSTSYGRFSHVIDSEVINNKNNNNTSEALSAMSGSFPDDETTIIGRSPETRDTTVHNDPLTFKLSHESSQDSRNLDLISSINRTVTASGLRREHFSTVMRMFGSCGRITRFKFGSKSATVTFSTEEEVMNALEMDGVPICDYIIRVRPVIKTDYISRYPFTPRVRPITNDPNSGTLLEANLTHQYSHPHTDCDSSDSNTASSFMSHDAVDKLNHCYNLYEHSNRTGVTRNSYRNSFLNSVDPLASLDMYNSFPSLDPPNQEADVKPIGLFERLIDWVCSLT